VGAAFLGALRLLARHRPLCLAVDDIQWLDEASVTALRYALARLDRARVAALLAVRGRVPPWLRRALPEGRLRTIEISGLSILDARLSGLSAAALEAARVKGIAACPAPGG
jgi:predicted ATPase